VPRPTTVMCEALSDSCQTHAVERKREIKYFQFLSTSYSESGFHCECRRGERSTRTDLQRLNNEHVLLSNFAGRRAWYFFYRDSTRRVDDLSLLYMCARLPDTQVIRRWVQNASIDSFYSVHVGLRQRMGNYNATG